MATDYSKNGKLTNFINTYFVKYFRRRTCQKNPKKSFVTIYKESTHRYFSNIFFRWLFKNIRNNHRGCSVKKGVLRNFTKFTGKQLCQSLFFNKVAGLRPVTLLEKRLWHKCFPVNFAKLLRATVLQNISGRLFLEHLTLVAQYIFQYT